MDETPPLLNIEGQVARITLNRQRYKNRIQSEDIPLLTNFFNSLAADRAVRAVIITGAGENVFSAGFDLNAPAPAHHRPLERQHLRRCYGLGPRLRLPHRHSGH